MDRIVQAGTIATGTTAPPKRAPNIRAVTTVPAQYGSVPRAGTKRRQPDKMVIRCMCSKSFIKDWGDGDLPRWVPKAVFCETASNKANVGRPTLGFLHVSFRISHKCEKMYR